MQYLFIKDPKAMVIIPALEEFYYTGNTIPITWENIGGEKVRIDLYRGNELIRTIINSTENTGEYLWTIPADQQISDEYIISIMIIDSPPYSGNSIKSNHFFIDNNAWMELNPIDALNAYDVTIALGTDNSPALVFRENNNKYKRAHFMKWNNSNGSWEGDYLSKDYSNYYSIAIGSDNIPYIAYTEAMLETRVKKWDGNSLQDCGSGSVHPFLDILPDSVIFGAAIALDDSNTPYVSYMAFLLMDLLRKEKPFYLFTSVLENEEWTTCGEILYRTDLIPDISFEDAALLTEPFYLEGGSSAVINYFDLTALFKMYFLQSIDDTVVSPDDAQGYITQNMDITLYNSIVIDNDNTPLVAYLELYNESPFGTKKKVRIHKYSPDEKNYTDGNWSFYEKIKTPLNDDNNKTTIDDADFQALAIGSDNIPVIVYKDNTNGKIAQVKRWNPTEEIWDSLGSPGSCSGEIRPAIVIDKNNNPIVACKNGVKRWDDSEREWVCLGFPNQPGNGYGNQSSWLAVNDNYLAVAYIKPSDRDRVCVKMLELE